MIQNTVSNDVMGELRDYLKAHPDFEKAFKEAFELARTYNIPQFEDPKFVPYKIETFENYLRFYGDMLKWAPSETSDGKNVYYHLCMFYFVIDLDPVKRYQTPIDPTSKKPWTWLSDWLISYAKAVGKFLDTEESLNAETLKSFNVYGMDQYPHFPGTWKTFNQFFARYIDPRVRPIAQGPNVIVSPADATFGGSWPIDSKAEVIIKGLPWKISELLGDHSVYANHFDGGYFAHSYLAPSDYHRQHTPVAGIVKERKVIEGLCYLQVIAKPDENGQMGLSAVRSEFNMPDDPGYQFIQARGVVVIDTKGFGDFGLVAVCPIGMAQVSSVVLNDNIKEGHYVEKGQEISHFQMGGSDIVVLFENNVQITARKDVHYKVGEEIAKFIAPGRC
ncbi:hypothetical protein PILCRDRAFT_582455 [Piloderma croceum F 1598]|uniref:Phosphatidylserine decarboxylase n=1 Tax=Piloderma croceum (strain F 1598) TaxID=765440 RepID=A0A0C3FFX5_PILCF|nr:hypothetical protein PILCRDRAFT_582455 [Piloderma croceum F 1598]